MKVVVTGSRRWTNRNAIARAISDVKPTEIIEGGCPRGADVLAREIARDAGIDVITYWPNWQRYDASAGPIRNQKMLLRENPVLVLAFPSRGSRGTWDMITQADARNVPVLIYDVNGCVIERRSDAVR